MNCHNYSGQSPPALLPSPAVVWGHHSHTHGLGGKFREWLSAGSASLKPCMDEQLGRETWTCSSSRVPLCPWEHHWGRWAAGVSAPTPGWEWGAPGAFSWKGEQGAGHGHQSLLLELQPACLFKNNKTLSKFHKFVMKLIKQCKELGVWEY